MCRLNEAHRRRWAVDLSHGMCRAMYFTTQYRIMRPVAEEMVHSFLTSTATDTPRPHNILICSHATVDDKNSLQDNNKSRQFIRTPADKLLRLVSVTAHADCSGALQGLGGDVVPSCSLSVHHR